MDLDQKKEDGVSMTVSLIIKIILRILFEGFLNSFPSVSGLESEGEFFLLMRFA